MLRLSDELLVIYFGVWEEQGVKGGREVKGGEKVYFCRLVFGGCDEVGSVGCPLKIFDLFAFFMGLEVLQQFSGLRKVLVVLHEVYAQQWLPTFESYCDTDPSSCPAMMYLER